MKGIFFFLFILIQPVVASADILFIDTNNAPNEIAAAERAAALRHEKLVVLPLRDTPEKKAAVEQLRDLQVKELQTYEPAVQIWRIGDKAKADLAREQKSSNPDPKKLQQLQSQIDKATSQYSEKSTELAPQILKIKDQMNAISHLPTYSDTELERVLADAEKNKRNFDTVIISGHYGFQEFYGSLGMVYKSSLKETFARHPRLFDSVRSIYGWGCYGATPAASTWWMNAFPHVDLVGGFDAGSASQERPPNGKYLEGLLVREAELMRKSDAVNAPAQVTEIAREIRAIPGFNMMNSAACTRAECVGMNTGIIDLHNLGQSCTQEAWDVLNNTSSRFKSVMQGGENPPCDTGRSWLREFYNQLRDHQHCGQVEGPLQTNYSTLEALADQVVKVIFWRQVISNAFAYNRTDFDQGKTVLTKMGVSVPDMSLAGACDPPTQGQKTLTFRDMTSLTQGICSQVYATSEPDQTILSTCCRHLSQLQQLGSCIPFSWVEPPRPGGEIEAPNCEK